ncbi:acetate--CoA ligase [Chryseobacterium tructae]|nr:acetate--CoA ligase [Chryseobacterium tructae]MDN3693848.1 acetate--CoA ligase [Chryseobacterium tructae]
MQSKQTINTIQISKNERDMRNYLIEDLPQYFEDYKKSIKNPKKFWDKVADQNFVWYQRWSKVVKYDMNEAKIEWFKNAKLNITKNCLDRHLAIRGDKTAIIWEPNDPKEEAQHISYNELYTRVNKTANVLSDMGIKKGDRVCIYLPMIPELAVTMLACAKLGAVHSVIFAGFSAAAVSSRVNDCEAKMVITSDGSYRGNKVLDLKSIVDEALEKTPTIENVLVVKRTHNEIKMKEGRDHWLEDLYEKASPDFVTVIMDSEDPLFILYTSGSTGKPKGMLHTCAGYMVYTAYTFKNVFNYKENDIYWCTADIGWITGHSYILYGPLLNGATTVIFEGVPTYPEPDRFWEVIEKHKITQFYTAPTAIRSLAKESAEWVDKHDLSSLKVIGSVGEPINDEAWHWFNDHVGKKKCPIVDTWWQTETGGIMISPLPFVTPTKPTYATLPLPGIQPVLMDDKRNEITGNQVTGNLCIRFPWPGIARTIWGDHQRYKETYFTAFPGKYFTGDGALRDEVGYYRITGRVDDVIIVSGHNLGTAPIEDSINQHPAVAESAIVGYPHDIKGNALYGYVMLKESGEGRDKDNLKKEINQLISDQIGPIAKLDKIQFVSGLPKTRSGKIMRRILRKIAEGDFSNFGDISTLLNPEIVDEIKNERI